MNTGQADNILPLKATELLAPSGIIVAMLTEEYCEFTLSTFSLLT
jgi:hypothetical protein